MQDKKPQGYLFDTVAFYNTEQLESALESLTAEQSFFYITVALQYAHKSGLFTMEETEILSKSIRNLKKNFMSENKTES